MITKKIKYFTVEYGRNKSQKRATLLSILYLFQSCSKKKIQNSLKGVKSFDFNTNQKTENHKILNVKKKFKK